MDPQTVPQKPRAAELLHIAVGAMAGLLAGALAGAAAFQSVVVALVGGVGGAVFGMIAVLKRLEGEDGRGGGGSDSAGGALAVTRRPVGSRKRPAAAA
jgi:hypothetical protein